MLSKSTTWHTILRLSSREWGAVRGKGMTPLQRPFFLDTGGREGGSEEQYHSSAHGDSREGDFCSRTHTTAYYRLAHARAIKLIKATCVSDQDDAGSRSGRYNQQLQNAQRNERENTLEEMEYRRYPSSSSHPASGPSRLISDSEAARIP